VDISGTYTGLLNGTTTDTENCGARIRYNISAMVTITVSGSGKAIDPYTGTISLDGTLTHIEISCPDECIFCWGDYEIPIDPDFYNGDIYGSSSKVEGSIGGFEVFTDGTFIGNTLTGTFTFTVLLCENNCPPIVKTITLTK